MPWQFFGTGLGSGGMALLNQQNLITKIYFPRLFLPTGVVGGLAGGPERELPDVCGVRHFLPLLPLALHARRGRSSFLPLVLIPLSIASLGVAYLLSAVTVTYRDFRFLVPVASQLWMWLSFVMMPRELLLGSPKLARWDKVLALNPMFGIIQAVRHVVLGMSWDPWDLVIGTVVASGVCVLGMFYFRRTERRFADIA